MSGGVSMKRIHTMLTIAISLLMVVSAKSFGSAAANSSALANSVENIGTAFLPAKLCVLSSNPRVFPDKRSLLASATQFDVGTEITLGGNSLKVKKDYGLTGVQDRGFSPVGYRSRTVALYRPKTWSENDLYIVEGFEHFSTQRSNDGSIIQLVDACHITAEFGQEKTTIAKVVPYAALAGAAAVGLGGWLLIKGKSTTPNLKQK